MKGLSLVSGRNLSVLFQITGTFFLKPLDQPLWIPQAILQFKIAENKVQVYKRTSASSLWVFLHVYKGFHCKIMYHTYIWSPSVTFNLSI